MPLVRKILVVAAVNGLVLQPLRQQQHQKAVPPIQVKYATQDISIAPNQELKSSANLEAHGVIGLLKIGSSAYLVALTDRDLAAQIKGKSIYVVTGVSLIPLSSQVDAQRAIDQYLRLSKPTNDPSLTVAHEDGTDDEGLQSGNVTADEDIPSESFARGDSRSPLQSQQSGSSIVQDVIRRKGQYGRFTERWFSRKGWASDKRRVSLNIRDGPADSAVRPQESSMRQTSDVAGQDRDADGAVGSSLVPTLLPKLLRTTKMLLNSKSFYFSYDYDLTRRMGTEADMASEHPLHKAVDPMFFWNHWLQKPLIEAGQHSYILPLMQGFVGQKAFTVDTSQETLKDSIAHVKEDVGEVIELQETTANESSDAEHDKGKHFLVTLISRRSIERAGLRYLRRGVDENGYVANAVETEQLLSDAAWSSGTGVYSFTQIRGSIPVFFAQSPYSFKPIPTLQHSHAVNHRAFGKHFSHLHDRYGKIQVASLVEQHGAEATVGEAFADHTGKLNEELANESSKVEFEWFDFHRMCAGMKFENVSLLMDSLQSKLDSFGFSHERDGRLVHRQSGILRTNCMDCLDRTNVVQSAAGAWALETQLSANKINLDLKSDASTQWFNALWADNGDAISKQYSSTAALKGDYTRTRKRDYRGAINDFGLTLTRYYNNIVNDYFSQTVIDYLLGNVGDSVFEEFEDKMMTADPGVSLSTIRQNAIDTSAKIVIADSSEELIGGWTMSTPANSNTLRTLPLREIVLLITDAAIYNVRFDWNTEKVASFERVDVCSIVRARRGTYITSTFTATQLDPQRNVGLVLTYRPTSQNLERHNTRSMSTKSVPRTGDKIVAMDDADNILDNAIASPDPTSPDAGVSHEVGGLTDPVDNELRSVPPDRFSKPSRPSLDPMASPPNEELKLLAFKALPARSSWSRPQRNSQGEFSSEADVVQEVCHALEKALKVDKNAGSSKILEEGDIIGIEEAKKSVGLLETLGHKMKKLVWA